MSDTKPITSEDAAARQAELLRAAHRLIARSRRLPADIDTLTVRAEDWSELDYAVTQCQQTRAPGEIAKVDAIRI